MQFFQTNHEGAFVEELHRLEDTVDGADPEPRRLDALLVAIRDALEIAGAAGRRGAPVRRRCARGLPPGLGDPRPVRRDDRRQGPGRLSRCARAPARRAEARERTPTARADRLVALLDERELDALLVTNLVNVRYLTGYTGSNGVALVGRRPALLRDGLPLRLAGRAAGARLRAPRSASRTCSRTRSPRCPPATCGWGSRTSTCRCARSTACARRCRHSVELVPAGGGVERLRS